VTDARGDIPNRPGPDRQSGDRPDGIPRDELDRLFDREMPLPERRAFTTKLRRDPGALDEVVDTKKMLELLRGPVETPDLTDRVLAGVAHRRGFLSARLRRRVRRGRWAAAAMFVISLGVVALAHRLYPGTFSLERRPTPVANLGEAVRRDSIDGRERFIEAVRHLGRLELAADSVRGTGEVAFGLPAEAGLFDPASLTDRPDAPVLAGPAPDGLEFSTSPDPALLALDAGITVTPPRLELAGVRIVGEPLVGDVSFSGVRRHGRPAARHHARRPAPGCGGDGGGVFRG